MSSSRILVPALTVLAAIPLAAMDSSDVQIHGFISQGYLGTSHNNVYGNSSSQGGTFDFNEVGINFTATPVDRLRVGAQIFAQNLGQFGNGKPTIDWAYGEYDLPTGSEDFGVKVAAGRVKINHGLYGDYRDLDMTRAAVFLPDSAYSTEFRDFFIAVNGAMITSDLSAGKLGSFRVHGYVGGQTVDEKGSIANQYSNAPGLSRLTNIQVERADGGGLEWNTPIDGLRFKGSIHHINHMVATAETDVVAPIPGVPPGLVASIPFDIDLTSYHQSLVGGEYQIGDVTIASEYSNAYWKAEIPSLLGQPASQSYSRMQGAYLLSSYRFLPKWECALQGSWMQNKNYVATNPVSDYRRMVGIALRFDPIEHWLIKAEFQRNRGTLGVYPADNPGGISEYWNLFAIKTTYDF